MKRVFAAALLTLATGVAHSADYVCNVAMTPPGGVEGDFGGISMQIHSGPSCTGAYKYNRNFCSVNNTAGWCAKFSGGYKEVAISAMFNALVDAAHTGKQVQSNIVQCKDGTLGCWSWVYFHGN